jgi:AcrR family transcriptional regulator
MPRAGLDSAAVVRVGAELADSEGLEAVTLARLSSRLGVRPPSLYAHVGGLEDLRARIGERGAGELRDALAAAVAGRSGVDALTALGQAYLEYARAHPGSYAALQQPAPTPAAAQLVGLVLAVLRGYGLEGEDAVHGARIVRAALHGFVELERAEGFQIPLELDETFRRLLAVLDRGLSGST